MPSLISRSAPTSRSLVSRLAEALHVPGPQDVLRPFIRYRRKRAKRAQIAGLLTQDDFLLADIGVTRDDVRAALRQAGDPALNLRRQARARRDAARTRRPV